MALPSSKISPIGNYREQPNKALISVTAFNTKLFSYSTYMDSNFVTQGRFAANSSATASNCPKGRVLHANGKILLPGVNPGITKYYMGVLDSASGLNGYIDPSDSSFASYDVNLPAQYDLGTQAQIPPLGGQGAKLQVGPDAGLLVQAAVDGAVNAGAAAIGSLTVLATSVTVTVNTTAATANSSIFLTQTAGTALPFLPVIGTVSETSFIINFSTAVPSGNVTLNWMIVN